MSTGTQIHVKYIIPFLVPEQPSLIWFENDRIVSNFSMGFRISITFSLGILSLLDLNNASNTKKAIYYDIDICRPADDRIYLTLCSIKKCSHLLGGREGVVVSNDNVTTSSVVCLFIERHILIGMT